MLPILSADGSDYSAVSEAVTFTSTVSRQCITVPILEDAISENDEQLMVSLSSEDPDVSSTLPMAGVTITDQDSITVGLEMDVYPTSEDVGFVEVCVVISGGELDREVVVTIATRSDTAEGMYMYVYTLLCTYKLAVIISNSSSLHAILGPPWLKGVPTSLLWLFFSWPISSHNKQTWPSGL